MPHSDDTSNSRKQKSISELKHAEAWTTLIALLGALSTDEEALIVQSLAQGLSPEQIAQKIREIRGDSDNECVRESRNDCDR